MTRSLRRLALAALAAGAVALPAAPASATPCYGSDQLGKVCTGQQTFADCIWVGSTCVPYSVTVTTCASAGGQYPVSWQTTYICLL
jgi:hypothetical protein